MSEADPIPPTSSATALRIPMIKKGEYDLWSMKMRQYIAITDHILWDIITNGDQPTTDPHPRQCLHQKLRLAANARRNNEKALNILLSAIPDRHLLSFHDAVYEHELKGVSNSSSQNIAFLSTEVKGSTLKQSTANPANIPKGYTQAPLKQVQTAPKLCVFPLRLNHMFFFDSTASMPTTYDDEDLLQIDEDLWKKLTYDGKCYDLQQRFAKIKKTEQMVRPESESHLTELTKDDWNRSLMAEQVHFGQDRLGDFDMEADKLMNTIVP
ncbi:hypothetical protein Tco_1235140 [Tanacetum coccineum]